MIKFKENKYSRIQPICPAHLGPEKPYKPQQQSGTQSLITKENKYS